MLQRIICEANYPMGKNPGEYRFAHRGKIVRSFFIKLLPAREKLDKK